LSIVPLDEDEAAAGPTVDSSLSATPSDAMSTSPSKKGSVGRMLNGRGIATASPSNGATWRGGASCPRTATVPIAIHAATMLMHTRLMLCLLASELFRRASAGQHVCRCQQPNRDRGYCPAAGFANSWLYFAVSDGTH